MIDHIGFGVGDYASARDFYSRALAPLGYHLIVEVAGSDTASGAPAAGFGRAGKPDFWIGGEGRTTPPVHIAIEADSRAAVEAFHAAALGAGATDNGGPGLRPQYHARYYAAFVRDADGNNIEAVCHTG